VKREGEAKERLEALAVLGDSTKSSTPGDD
jgi:hypothetical protein